MKRVSLIAYVDPDVRAAVEAFAAEHGLTVSAAAGMALRHGLDYLATWGPDKEAGA